jgi:outer membrane protein OmpA-like peptidoglycan-associated protein
VTYNPAIAGGRYLVDVNLASVAQQQQTDALSFNQFDSYFFSLNEYFDYRNRYSGDPLDEIPLLGSFSENQRVLLPGSFMMTLGNKRKNKSAVVFSYELRNHSNFRNLPIDFLLGYLRYPDKTQYSGNAGDVALNIASWKSFNLSYSQVIMDQGKHLLTGGLTIKMLQGINAMHFYATDLNIAKTSDSLTSLAWTNANFFQTDGIGQGNGTTTSFSGEQPAGFGGDLGFIYEFRPEFNDLNYQMNDTYFRDHTKIPYLFAVGASLTDLGSLRFNNVGGPGKIGGIEKTFSDFTLFDQSGRFNDTLRANAKTENVSEFKFIVPAHLNLFADFNGYKGAGINIAYSMPVRKGSQNDAYISAGSLLTITPKFEHKHFGAYIPISLPEDQDFHIGLSLRAGPVFFGTNDLNSMITASTDSRSSGHWFFGVRVPILNKKHKDTDHDYYSDDVDACIDLSGVKSAKGCPDQDGDTVQDKDDKCVDVPGLATLNGCPDKDGDGIIDANDFCPDAMGPAEGTPKCGCPDEDKDGFIDSNGDDKCPGLFGAMNGCPDRDGDGVNDHEDKCPDEPGKGFVSKAREPFIISGCPDVDNDGLATFEDACPDSPGSENNAGCPLQDYDKDGIYDFEDSCETVFGERALKGCPPRKTININILMNIVYFEQGDSLSIVETGKVTELLPLLLDHVAEQNASAIILEGHADVNEPADERKALSIARAERVKRLLISEGIPEKNIIVSGKSDQEPTTKRSFPEGKYINRRVEILLDAPQTN